MYITTLEDKQTEIAAIKTNVEQLLDIIGEDRQREGLQRTPERVAKSLLQLVGGYGVDPIAVLNSAKFTEQYSRPVIVKNIEFYSLCEHHILPFFGKVHITYIPNGCIVGLSKIPRVVDILSHRLQVQERFTRELCQCIQQALQPRGVMVVVEAQHMCMQMRGIEKQGSVTVTSDYTGEYTDPALREEFMQSLD